MSQELIAQIQNLKQKNNAVILVHNYQRADVQEVADYLGDSLGLSRQAAETDADLIVFCGVHFMAETAAILAPGKRVLLPDLNAGCPMADMVTPRELQRLKDQHPDAVVVTYVNSSAEIKAMSDICCTSANAVEVVRGVAPEKEILFVPDRNLGNYCARQTGRDLVLWEGYCPTHERMLPEHVKAVLAQYPESPFVAHPECTPTVVDLADAVASTTGIIKYCRESQAQTIIVGTEIGLLHRLRRENPEKTFIPASPIADCPNMKLVTLEKLLWCLEDLSGEVIVPNDIAQQALKPIERMLEVTGD
ncbi:MAG: quinolinate synthase NadA [Planctomycetota bacterium]